MKPQSRRDDASRELTEEAASALGLVALGAIARPHGVLGEVRVHRFNPDSEVLLGQEVLYLRRDGVTRAVRVESARPHKEVVLVVFQGTRGREAAEALRGHEVCVPRAVLPPVPDDEYYHVDLIGLRAVDADGVDVGVVSDVIRYPSADCLLVASGDVQREVPLTESYVGDVDLEAGRVVVLHLDDLEPIPKRTR